MLEAIELMNRRAVDRRYDEEHDRCFRIAIARLEQFVETSPMADPIFRE